MLTPAFEIAVLRKADHESLTKRLSLDRDGQLVSDGSACRMAHGTAQRFPFNQIDELAQRILGFGSDEALTLGALRPDLPNEVDVIPKRRLNGTNNPQTVARSGEFFVYRPEAPAFALIDFDMKGMPVTIAQRIKDAGGFWRALVSVLPDLAQITHLTRLSTSAGLYRTDNGAHLTNSGGMHVFLGVTDGSDIERFLHALHARCWLAGLGWFMVGAAGQLLERSIVDRVVGTPERLVFEGPPILLPPLAQTRESRQPRILRGKLLDTFEVCPDLTIVQTALFKEQRAKEAVRLAPQAAAARKAWVARHAEELVARTSLPLQQATAIIEQQCNGVLLPDVVLPFDDPDLHGYTVRDVLTEPERFLDATLADPLEGVAYGVGKAKIVHRADGTPWIHSFAHGRTVYLLCYDAAMAEGAIAAASAQEAGHVFVRVVLALDPSLGTDTVTRLRDRAAAKSGLGKRTLDAMLKETRQRTARQRAEEERAERENARRDKRPLIDRPFDDEPWLPQVDIINEVLGPAGSAAPPARDSEHDATAVRGIRLLSLHLLTTGESNPETKEEGK